MEHLAAKLSDDLPVFRLRVKDKEIRLLRGILQAKLHHLMFAEKRLAATCHAQHKTVAGGFGQPVHHHKIAGNGVLAIEHPCGVTDFLGVKGHKGCKAFSGQTTVHGDTVQPIGQHRVNGIQLLFGADVKFAVNIPGNGADQLSVGIQLLQVWGHVGNGHRGDHQPTIPHSDVVQAVGDDLPLLTDVVGLRGGKLCPLELPLLVSHRVRFHCIQLALIEFHSLVCWDRQERNRQDDLRIQVHQTGQSAVINVFGILRHGQHPHIPVPDLEMVSGGRPIHGGYAILKTVVFASFIFKIELPVILVTRTVKIVEDAQPLPQFHRDKPGTHPGEFQRKLCPHPVKMGLCLLWGILGNRHGKIPLLDNAGPPADLVFQNSVHFFPETVVLVLRSPIAQAV